jgi:hypothetical protein
MPKRDSDLRLPVEILDIVIRYAVSVPEFFDPDYESDRFPPWVANKRRWFGLKRYREAEDTRGALQRACSSSNKS